MHNLISVIIPFKERFEKVERALRSVEAQTYKNVEVILVDDASEGSFDIDLKLFNLVIKYVRLEVNQGPGGARNEGLKHAEGTYIAFLDSDDYWQPEFLGKTIAVHSETSDLAFVYSFARIINNDNDLGLRKGGIMSNTILPGLFQFGRPWCTSSCVWTKSVVDKIGDYIKTRCWEDYDFDVRAAILNNKIACIPDALTVYEISGADNLSSQSPGIALIEKSQSMMNISQNLRRSLFKSNFQVCGFFLNAYLGVTAQLVDIEKFEQSKVNLDEIKKWSVISKPSMALARIFTGFRFKISSRYIRQLKSKLN